MPRLASRRAILGDDMGSGDEEPIRRDEEASPSRDGEIGRGVDREVDAEGGCLRPSELLMDYADSCVPRNLSSFYAISNVGRAPGLAKCEVNW
jgi:hypothetical protein